MAKVTDKIKVSDSVLLYMQSDLRNWMARFKVGNTWYQKTTKESDQQRALIKAIELQTEYRIMMSNNIPVHTSRRAKRNLFSEFASKVVEELEVEIAAGNKADTYRDYVGALKKYHIPFFKDMPIKSIDQKKLLEFEKWRTEKLGRTPAKSTILTHNAAMNKIFTRAVLDGVMYDGEVPNLKNKGATGERRAAFTRGEYKLLLASVENSTKSCRKQVTKEIRTLLYYYMEFAVLTGIRPGKEIDYLTWGDIHQRKINSESYTTVTVRKGKTTKFTGTREIVCKDAVKELLENFKKLQQKTNKDDLIFTLPDGTATNELSANFNRFLRDTELKEGAHGKRSLYSLRHSYITWELEKGTQMQVIATQCGTSLEMIQRHYSHVVPSMFAAELSGRAAVRASKKQETGLFGREHDYSQDMLTPTEHMKDKMLTIKDGVVVVAD